MRLCKSFIIFILWAALLLNGCSAGRTQAAPSAGAPDIASQSPTPLQTPTQEATPVQTPTQEATPATDLQPDSVDAVLNKLTSDAFEGRMTGTEGNRLAADYLMEQYQRMGLQPIDEDYFHEYSQTVIDEAGLVNDFILFYQDGTQQKLELGRDFLEQYEGSIVEASGSVTFNNRDPELSQKIYVTEDSSTIKDALLNGAKAVLYKDDSFARMSVIPEYVGVEEVPVVRISTETFSRLKAENLKKVDIQLKAASKEALCTNVSGVIPGKDHRKAVVLSAHFDHVGKAGNTLYRGALDNASGVAVLLDTGRKLMEASQKEPFGMDIILCAYNGEEYILKGSGAFAEAIQKQYDSVYNINFDCLGRVDGGELVITGDKDLSYELYSELAPFVAEEGLLCKWSHMKGISDYKSFIEKGLAAINLSQEYVEGIHTPKDTVGNLDVAYLEKISTMMVKFLTHFRDRVF